MKLPNFHLLTTRENFDPLTHRLAAESVLKVDFFWVCLVGVWLQLGERVNICGAILVRN
jgi:hypothetical protein